MKNAADLSRRLYPPWPSASVDNTLLDLQNPFSLIRSSTKSQNILSEKESGVSRQTTRQGHMASGVRLSLASLEYTY